jgi:3-oxoacyl-[acyl-carrier-protein] synthase III
LSSRIIGTGGYLPTKIVSNQDLEKSIDTNDEWIRSRTGITQRHIAEKGEYSSHMGYKASLEAIKDAGIQPSEIDLVIVCTNTPDNSFPSVANKIQGYLNLGQIPSFDLQAICSGFLYGMQVADSMLKSGKYKTILLVCADKMSSILDWEDRSTCVLFGDGAGAVILQSDDSDRGIIDSFLYSDGSMFDILYTDGGVSSNQKSGVVKMKGPEVFKAAIEKMGESVNHLLAVNNIDIKDVSYFIPHQANLRIINSLVAKFGLDESKVITTVQKHANCSASSIPLALAEFRKSNIIKPGEVVVFTAFGAGATWGSMVIKW